MANLFLLDDAGTRAQLACPEERALGLDAFGREAASWQIAVVSFAATPRTPRRWVLVAAPGARVHVGSAPVHAGVTELHDRDHVVLDRCEAIFSADALPAPLTADPPDAPCPVCATPLADACLFACNRCGMRACRQCWDLAPRRRCLTPGCPQPAALDRPLWEPAASDFIAFEGAA